MSFVDFWFYPAAVLLFALIALIQFVFRKVPGGGTPN